ncbi:MAG TPA: NAD(P)-binding domain-containing protein [Flavitalea sp.]|nr:NAD(P)-binding domain-containing protein [Flavitalea sp.]
MKKRSLMQFGIIGSGTWATALAKILTDNGNTIHWLIRNEQLLNNIMKRRHNPKYLSAVYFNTSLLQLYTDVNEMLANCDHVIAATPSAFIIDILLEADEKAFEGKKVISAIKGILPKDNLLLNDFLNITFKTPLSDYFTVMGPCHAEEVAAEKLSYLTFSGIDISHAKRIADCFVTEYMNTSVNDDVIGVQFAAVLKNIYALGAGIAHGLEYGDNFLSVLIANCADEMAGFLRKAGIRNMDVGVHAEDRLTHKKSPNYAASVYLGDLLVTCYSLFSRNRTFGNMIGKGYSVSSAKLETDMVAEGYYASERIFSINKKVQADMPIAGAIYRILWENLSPREGFKRIEDALI